MQQVLPWAQLAKVGWKKWQPWNNSFVLYEIMIAKDCVNVFAKIPKHDSKPGKRRRAPMWNQLTFSLHRHHNEI